MPDGQEQRIVIRPIEDEMKKSYIDYAMSVIVGRALPDVRDGLKPVHRRVLWSMHELGMAPGGQFRKCARVVGDCIGKFHPHGEMAVYDALIRMGQDFSMRAELVDGQGNFGSVDGDPPAAMRYTECRLTKVAQEMLQDIERETVDFVDNFDATLKEPTVLPSKFPNLLVNGSSGIAVGMATNVPPHNLGEVVDGLVHLIEHPDARLEDIVHPERGPIRGPDFPTGGTVYGFPGVIEAYSKGRGLIKVRAKLGVEDHEGRRRVIVREIPYMVNKGLLLETIAGLVREKRLDGVADLRDESDREGMRIVIDLKKDALEDAVVAQLFTHTQLEVTFSIINIALVSGEPKTLGLLDLLRLYLAYREEVIRRRTQFDLNKAQARLHIVEGLITAVDHLDEVITLIRRSRAVEQAKQGLMVRYLLSEEQAKAILEMRLQKLTALGIQELRDEQTQLKGSIADLEAILASRERVLGIIRAELLELKEKYADARRTSIVAEAVDLEVEDLIPLEDNVVVITNTGYAKRVPMGEYRLQARGGKGLIGMETKEEDYVTDLFIASTHEYIMWFTSKGRCFWLKCYKIPPGTRYSKGKPLVNLLPRLEAGEHVQARISVKSFDDRRSIVFATKEGVVKRTNLSAYSHIRVNGINAINLREGDELVTARLVDGDEEIILASRGGLANRFPLAEAREIGRVATGVIGMRLREGDEVVSMAVVKDPKTELLTLLQSGFGKRTLVEEYRKTRRGSQGVKTTDTKRGSQVVAVREVTEGDGLLVTTTKGKVIRCPVAGISLQGRGARGVRIIRLDEADEVAAVARLIGEQEGEKMITASQSEIPPPSPYPGPGPSRPHPQPTPEPDDDE